MPDWIDAHVHFWRPDRLAYPWLADEPALNRAYLPADLGFSEHGIAAAVMVEAGRRPEQALDEVLAGIRWSPAYGATCRTSPPDSASQMRS